MVVVAGNPALTIGAQSVRVADHLMARLYREAPLNSIWEGSGNVNALDVLREALHDDKLPQAWVLSSVPYFHRDAASAGLTL